MVVGVVVVLVGPEGGSVRTVTVGIVSSVVGVVWAVGVSVG